VRNILIPSAQKQLVEFLARDPLLVFDYDGTLCPIVSHASDAVLRPETQSLLRALCDRYICVLLSGRARKDVVPLVAKVPFAQIVGSHGEDWANAKPGEKARRKVILTAFEQLDGALKGLEGVKLENKGLSLSVHYRHAKNRRIAKARILRVLSRMRTLRVIGGKEVFNLLPKGSGGKGGALRELKKMFGKREALFIGDDLTDEDGFGLPAREHIFKIRVSYSSRSKADYYIPSQADIDALLKVIGLSAASLPESA